MKRPLVLGKHRVGLYYLHSKTKDTQGIVLSVTTAPSCQSSVLFSNNVQDSSFSCNNSSCNSSSKFVSNSVWHNRLGHSPMYKLKTLDLNKHDNVDFNEACDVCYKAI